MGFFVSVNALQISCLTMRPSACAKLNLLHVAPIAGCTENDAGRRQGRRMGPCSWPRKAQLKISSRAPVPFFFALLSFCSSLCTSTSPETRTGRLICFHSVECCMLGFCSSVRSIIIRMPKNTFALVYCNRACMQ